MGSRMHDPDAVIDGVSQQINENTTGGADINGASFDRASNGNPQGLAVGFSNRNNGSGQDAVFLVEESADDSSWSTVDTVTVADGEDEFRKYDLASRERYLRVTYDDSASAVATATDLAAFFALIGANVSQEPFGN